MTDSPFITVDHLQKTYHTPAGNFPALKDISFQVPAGCFTMVTGKSGAGKSTLVNMLTGVDTLSSGEIFIGGSAIHTLDENEMALWRGLNVGVIYQSFQLLPKLTVLENILIPMDFCDLYVPGKSQEWAMSILEKVELADQAHKFPSTLSGGQQQRAAIARAMANDPPLIIADEPTGNLDSKATADIIAIFCRLNRDGITIILVTHEMDVANQAKRIVRLLDGQIIEDKKVEKPAC